MLAKVTLRTRRIFFLFSYIIYSLDGINDEEKEKRLEITESINHSVRNVINSLRETIWAISDTNINIQDFSDKLKVFSRNLFKYSETHIDYTENISAKRELNALLGLNLYRICQEILNNAFKYANAHTIQIIVACEEDKILIIIKDNGIGFDCAQENGDCYGLQNIKKRAEEFNIEITLETAINKGVKYTLIV